MDGQVIIIVRGVMGSKDTIQAWRQGVVSKAAGEVAAARARSIPGFKTQEPARATADEAGERCCYGGHVSDCPKPYCSYREERRKAREQGGYLVPPGLGPGVVREVFAADPLDKRSVDAGMDALDRLWEALPAEDGQETGDLWAPYQHVRYLLEQLSARVPEHGDTWDKATAENRYDPAIAERRLRELFGGYSESSGGD